MSRRQAEVTDDVIIADRAQFRPAETGTPSRR